MGVKSLPDRLEAIEGLPAKERLVLTLYYYHPPPFPSPAGRMCSTCPSKE
jgi:hypothetical protein